MVSNRRRQLLRGSAAIAGLGVLAGCGVRLPWVQQPTRMPRIGVLSSGPSDPVFNDALRQGLRDHGYVEGQSIVIEARYADGKEDRLPDLAAEIVRLPVD